MKKLFLLIISVSFSITAFTQDPIHFDKTPSWCGTDAFTEEYFEQNPGAREAFMEKMEAVYQHRDQLQAKRSGDAIEPFVIPVVVHVIHDNGTGNISLEQVQDAIDLLNEDYGRTNEDADQTRAEFQPIATPAPFEFRLAKLDPTGSPTDGVVRINDPSNTYNVRNEPKGVSYWNSRNYFNIWIVNSIRSSSGGGGTVLGFAQFPGTGSWSTYGLVMRHDQFGRIGTSRADGRTLTHEVGHCLGLYHTFQSGCGSDCSSSGDRVCDTPPVSTSTWSCSFTQNTCSNDNRGISFTSEGDTLRLTSDYPDQIENYMSYDDCQNMFSKGQVDVMVSVMSQFSRLITLSSDDNLDNTGVGLLYEANFEADRKVVCAGQSVNYKDLSFYGQNLWSWTLTGAEPSNPGIANPTVTYNEPGIYGARLSVSNGQDIRNKNRDDFIVVSPTRGYFNDFTQDFEDGIFPSSKWIADEENEDGVTWESTSVAASGSKAIKLANFNADANNTDYLYTAGYDLAPYSSATLKFKYAYANQVSTSNSDRLIISYSKDCGETWDNFWNVGNGNLATASDVNGTEFVPTANDWVEVSRPLLNDMLSEGLILRFTFLSGGGNNLYIDDFDIDENWKAQPTLQSPESGNTVETFDVLLDWKSHPDADQYEYELSTDNSFATVMKSGILTKVDMDPDDIDTEIMATGLERGGLYFWRVRAITNGIAGQWSDVWFFRVSQTISAPMSIAESSDLKLYPNPSEGRFNVVLSGPESEYDYKITDLSGKLMVQGSDLHQNGSSRMVIDAQDWAKGIYFLDLKSGSDYFVEKLIIK